MRIVTNLFLALGLALSGTAAHAAGAAYSSVWSTVKEGAYAQNPSYQTTYDSLFDDDVNILEIAARRTLSTNADVLPWFQKLVHPVGICFSGTWTIDAASDYTGYFAEGAKGLIIVRASEALGSTDAGDYRAFGLAGKIFPTTDRTSTAAVETANFFTVDDLGGTLADTFLETTKTNKPPASFHLSQLAMFPMLREIARTFKRADTDPGVRQVYQIGELGLTDPSTARSPYLMGLVSETGYVVANVADFRDELRLANYPDGLRFGIYVSDSGDSWQRLGQIRLTEEALSDGCDHRLHFQHPVWK